jgi:hypothetical protein
MINRACPIGGKVCKEHLRDISQQQKSGILRDLCVCVWNMVSSQDYSSRCGAVYPEDGEAGSPETSIPI